VVQGTDGIGYVTGEVSAADAAAIDALLAATARSLGAEDPRTDQQRRADLFADLLLGRITFDDQPEDQEVSKEAGTSAEDGDDRDISTKAGASASAVDGGWLEVEDIDPDTGELLGTHLQRLDAEGETTGEPVDASSASQPSLSPRVIRRPRTQRIGVVVPLASLLDASEAAGEMADRSGFIPGEALKDQISEALASNTGDRVLFTRLLTDDGGRLLDVTELGSRPSTRLAAAINIRAGSCRFPTCTVPADRCDLDHHQPTPDGETSGRNLDPFCRRHHRGKTFAWHAAHRDDHGVDWTMPDAEHYRCIDQPLPTGRAAQRSA
jgi:hypothetical protein